MHTEQCFPTQLQRQTVDETDRLLLGKIRRAASRHPQRFVAADYRTWACIAISATGFAEREAFVKERISHFLKVGLLVRARCGAVMGFVVPKQNAFNGFTPKDIQYLKAMGVGL